MRAGVPKVGRMGASKSEKMGYLVYKQLARNVRCLIRWDGYNPTQSGERDAVGGIET